MGSPDEHGPGFAVIDVETTGFSPEDDRIVEVGVVVLDPTGRETGAFCTLVDPGWGPGPPISTASRRRCWPGPPRFAAIHPFLADRLSGRGVVGHNVDNFDLGFLRAECRRAGGVDLVPGALASVDTLAVARPTSVSRGGPGWSSAVPTSACRGTTTTARWATPG